MAITKFINKDLGDLVISEMTKTLLKTDSAFSHFAKDETNGRIMMTSLGALKENTHSRIRYSLNKFHGYGYDLTATETGKSVREIYAEELARVKASKNEKIIAEGIVDNVRGWYVTKAK